MKANRFSPIPLRRRAGGALAVLLALLVLAGAACSGGGDTAGDEAGGVMGGVTGRGPVEGAPLPLPAQEDAAGEAVDTAGERLGGDAGAASSAARLPEIGPAVIKTAELGLQVARGGFREALQEAIDVAGAHGGYVLSTSTAGDEARSGSLVMRVPAERFEQALSALKDIALRVTSETVRGEDVTQQFIDLEARLRNLRAQEAVLLRLMDRAQSVSDTIRVQNQLTGVQLDIERIRGRLRYLEDQTAMSTISVSMRERGAPAPGRAGVLQRAWERAIEVALGIVAALIVGVGAAVPLIVLGLLVIVAVRLLRPRFRPAP